MPTGREPAAQAAAEPGPVNPYPHARWRLANPTELSQVVLWVSQILIRYDGSNKDPAFCMADWHSESPGVPRSRAEALTLTRALREQAVKEPARFAELAAEHSEDVATQALGGSLGGVPASYFILWPTVLDALAATPVGQVSQVIETQYGFHVLLRRAAPPEETVTGKRIVIAHQAAGWIQVLGKGEAPQRTREQALALANQLYEQARQKPEEFSKLVEQYSDHRDAERGGDMGTWSTREPTFYPREVEILKGLRVGEITKPVDSLVGFEIIQRVPNQPREHYAMDEIRLFFDPTHAAPDLNSPPAVLAKAAELSLKLRSHPSRFDSLRKEFCCSYSEQWDEGRGSPAVTTALSLLKPGQIAPQPIRSELSYVIAKRVVPPPRDDTDVRFELPAPEVPDIRALLRSHDDNFFRGEVEGVGKEAVAKLSLSESSAQRITELHRPRHFENLDTSERRDDTWGRLLKDVEDALGPDGYKRYLSIVNAHFSALLFDL